MVSKDRQKIEEYFGNRTGSFLEIGAHDGVTDSLTIGLVEKGWSGVVVEPNPTALATLIKNMEPYHSVAVVGAAVGERTGLSDFWIEPFGGQRSTTSTTAKEFFWKYQSAKYMAKPLLLRQVSVAELLRSLGGASQFSLLVIDAEGESGSILTQFPIADMTTTDIVCVEIDRCYEETEAVLSPYYNCELVGVNVFGVRKK